MRFSPVTPVPVWRPKEISKAGIQRTPPMRGSAREVFSDGCCPRHFTSDSTNPIRRLFCLKLVFFHRSGEPHPKNQLLIKRFLYFSYGRLERLRVGDSIKLNYCLRPLDSLSIASICGESGMSFVKGNTS